MDLEPLKRKTKKCRAKEQQAPYTSEDEPSPKSPRPKSKPPKGGRIPYSSKEEDDIYRWFNSTAKNSLEMRQDKKERWME